MKIVKKLFVLLVVGFVLLGCTDNAGNSANKNNKYEYFSSQEDVFEIETSYFSLYYPSKWEDAVNVSIKDDEDYIIVFSTIINNTEIQLFSIIYGEIDEAYSIGTVEFDNHIFNVCYLDYSDNFPVNLSDDKYDMLSEMSEDINVVISNLIARNGLKLK